MATPSYEPRPTTVKVLFALSRNVCAFADPQRGRPTCEEKLTDPAWKRVSGRICHIQGEKPTSARFNEAMTDEQRRAYENLILLCPNHHTLIDDLEPDNYSVDFLTEMKQRAETAGGRGETDWATEAALEHFARLALLEYRRWHAPEEVDGEPADNRELYERLGELKAELTVAEGRLAGMPGPQLGEGPHLPWVRAWEQMASRVQTLRNQIAEVDAALNG